MYDLYFMQWSYYNSFKHLLCLQKYLVAKAKKKNQIKKLKIFILIKIKTFEVKE